MIRYRQEQHALLPRTEREVVNLASMAASELVVGARNHTQFIVAVTVEDVAHHRVSVVFSSCKFYSNLCEERKIRSCSPSRGGRMLYKVGPPSFSSGHDGEISRETTQRSGALSSRLEDVTESEDPGAFSMPTLASILRTAVEIGAVAGTGSGSDNGSGCSSDSSRAPIAGHHALAHPEPQPGPEVCSPRREGRSLDLSLLSLSEGAWVRQMNWAVMQPYWRHQRTGETQWDEVPEALSLQARAHLFRARRTAGSASRGDAYSRRGGTLPFQRAIVKHNSNVRSRRPLRVM